ncbi:helix-hairpin-helix domain-containing protein, partial [Neisseria meningitidis]|nr:helix-hairpin-helix domain-containing protein [Neisseria meningitidis]
QTLAQNIVAYRNENGAFDSRKKLLKVPRLGEKTVLSDTFPHRQT